MYKDKDKQREANRAAQARFKAKAKGITKQGITIEGITQIPIEQMCITDDWQEAIDKPPDSITLHPAIIRTINRLTTNSDGTVDEQARTIRLAAALDYQRMYPDKHYTGVGVAPEDMLASPAPVRVSKPGDADYVPLCQTTRDWCEGKRMQA